MGRPHRRGAEPGRQRVVISDDPATEEPIGEVPIDDPSEVRAAVERARAAQGKWSRLAVEERCEVVLRARDALLDHMDELVELDVRETGKPRFEALLHDILVMAEVVGFYAKNAGRILAPRELELGLLKHRRAYVHYAPRGVVAVISPWNFPLVIPMSDAFGALIAGNAVVLKPSEVAPLVTRRAHEICCAVEGLSGDLFGLVNGGPEVGVALIDARPDRVVFTGSVAAGRKVAAACGERLIPVTLELGGKAAAIVCDDADLDRAAHGTVFGALSNSGQACIGVERVYVHRSVHDPFVRRVVELAQRVRQGSPRAHDTDVGAMTYGHQMEVVERLVADAVARGAEVRLGGKRGAGPGRFFEPTVVVGCTQDMAIMREEIFGPVIPIMAVSGDEEAVALTNDSPLGLANYVFTRDRERGRRLAEQIRSGSVVINDVWIGYGAAEAPFGGVKDSGWGRVHGEEGLREHCETRQVIYDRIALGAREPIWFPYGEKTYRLVQKAARLLYRSGNPVRKVLDLF